MPVYWLDVAGLDEMSSAQSPHARSAETVPEMDTEGIGTERVPALFELQKVEGCHARGSIATSAGAPVLPIDWVLCCFKRFPIQQHTPRAG